MTECVHVIVLKHGETITGIGGVYAHEDRVEQIITVLEQRSDVEHTVDYQTIPVDRSTAY